MNETQAATHTPGPWRSTVKDGRVHIQPENSAGLLAVIEKGIDAEDVANARLMAAAPDLLDALLYIADRVRDEHLEDVANKAIDKATNPSYVGK